MTGIHHITAIAGRAATNIAFYTQVLGLRLVKKTVNFDDPGTYHLYYGDEAGAPGTILTFFPWEHAATGRAGIGLTQETAFRIPAQSLGYWMHRLVEKGVPHGAHEKRFGETRLPLSDPDGAALVLVGRFHCGNPARIAPKRHSSRARNSGISFREPAVGTRTTHGGSAPDRSGFSARRKRGDHHAFCGIP